MKPKKDLPVWRSLLYVPTNVTRFVERAHTRGADVIHLDLEDSIPASEKERARELLPAAAKMVRRGGADVLVRINRPLDLAVADIKAAILPEVDGITITKAQSADHIRLLDELVSETEAQRGLEVGRTKFLVMIETPAAFFRIFEIANAVERMAALTIGGEDFALQCNMLPTDETLLYPKQQMIIAAATAGLVPVGYLSSVADYSDIAKFRDMVIRSRQFGFQAANCVHPSQVAVVNEVYTPSAEEVSHAQKIIAGDAEAEKSGRGAFTIDGKMIDKPVVDRASRLLARHEKILQRAALAAAAKA